ncbi:hypothetical protein KAR91_45700, partial [Candidatus Pacearchaeota archaeon]|nr:hypothetical protein [Candidatus Pacearchaeota archaeon]
QQQPIALLVDRTCIALNTILADFRRVAINLVQKHQEHNKTATRNLISIVLQFFYLLSDH